jgi:hypothetical protein
MEGIIYCEECGQILSPEHANILATRRLQGVNANNPAKTAWGTTRLGKFSEIIIKITDAASVTLPIQHETTLGRLDPTTGKTPGLDLTPYGGQEKGVSRFHAAILRDGDTLTLVDKGSANGTFLNGQALITNSAYIIHDGDEIRLGRLICHIYFKA